ncbi:GA-like domain-containing protein, partial [Brevundimonas vesicularis]|uniref:GA-like domain-containing protein n=1 Tax=Brevundimonas vesicularis TaxID=41276 RepID=UPI001C686B93
KEAQDKVQAAKDAEKALDGKIGELTKDDGVFSADDAKAVETLKTDADAKKAAADEAVKALDDSETEKAGLQNTVDNMTTPYRLLLKLRLKNSKKPKTKYRQLKMPRKHWTARLAS